MKRSRNLDFVEITFLSQLSQDFWLFRCQFNIHPTDPVDLEAEENSEFILKFAKPAKAGSTFEEIRWYKGSRANSIVYYVQGAKPTYFKDYCSSHCNASNRVSLDSNTGQLTIFKVNLRDEDYYYYKYSIHGEHECGNKYEIKVEVSSKCCKIKNFWNDHKSHACK